MKIFPFYSQEVELYIKYLAVISLIPARSPKLFPFNLPIFLFLYIIAFFLLRFVLFLILIPFAQFL